MPTQAHGTQFVDAPPERIAELLRTAIARLNMRIGLINDDLCELSASLLKTQKIKSTTWQYEYHLVANWQPQAEGTLINMVVDELRYGSNTDKCAEIWTQVMQVVVEKAEMLKEQSQVRPASTKFGSSKFATEKDLMEAGYIDLPGEAIRVVVGPSADYPGQQISLTPEDTNKHALICGPTGCGKTTGLIIPNLIERVLSSAIVTEATAGDEMPDLYMKTARYRQDFGHRVFYFNPNDMSSDRINPIDLVEGTTDAQNLAELVMKNTTDKYAGGDPFWPDSEKALLSVLIVHAKAVGGDLGLVRRLLNEGPVSLKSVLAQSPSDWVKEQYRGFLNSAQEGVQRGVFSGLMTRLRLWTNPKIVALTEKTDMDLKALRKKLFTFYLAVPANKSQLKPLAAMVFNYFLGMATEGEFSFPLMLCLDEFTNFGAIRDIASNLSIIRHRKLPAMIGIQDYVQLEEAYGRNEARAIFTQLGLKCFFPPRDLQTAKQISEMLGRQTIVERKMTSSGQIVERELGRALLEPSELLTLGKDRFIAFTPGAAPVLVNKYTWKDYEDKTSEPPLPRLEIVVDDSILKKCAQSATKPDWQKEFEQSEKTDKGRGQKAEPAKTSKAKGVDTAPTEDVPVAEPEQPPKESTTKPGATPPPSGKMVQVEVDLSMFQVKGLQVGGPPNASPVQPVKEPEAPAAVVENEVLAEPEIAGELEQEKLEIAVTEVQVQEAPKAEPSVEVPVVESKEADVVESGSTEPSLERRGEQERSKSKKRGRGRPGLNSDDEEEE